MAVAARRLAKEKGAEYPDLTIVCEAVESKAEFLAALAAVSAPIREFHFIGHSGLYGPMYGTTSHPDQMSRAEWAALSIPFSGDAEAFFRCCRSARWFAPFFARQFRIPAHGYMSYTTFSHDPNMYVPVRSETDREDVFVVSSPGMKGMGISGAIRKRLGRCRTLPMTRFEPQETEEHRGYDGVADLYDAVFEDFRVREDEWKWLSRNMPEGARVLDLGCGNGALLLALAPLLAEGVGVDASGPMIEIARRRARGEKNLSFVQISGPAMPFPDGCFDVVVSMLSWRYLDWDPVVAEIQRVLKPGGRVLIVDMVVSPFHWKSSGRVLKDKASDALHRLRHPAFRRSLKRLVEDRGWEQMLRHNPMRAQHEYRWYLPSRFPTGKVESLNLSMRSEIIAFRWDAPSVVRVGDQASSPC